jgi:hypothetical protein
VTRLAATAACGLALLAASCAHKQDKAKGPTTRATAAQERHDRALKDPFGYKPDWSGTGVSGGGTGELDKEGLRRDIDHVFIR